MSESIVANSCQDLVCCVRIAYSSVRISLSSDCVPGPSSEVGISFLSFDCSEVVKKATCRLSGINEGGVVGVFFFFIAVARCEVVLPFAVFFEVVDGVDPLAFGAFGFDLGMLFSDIEKSFCIVTGTVPGSGEGDSNMSVV